MKGVAAYWSHRNVDYGKGRTMKETKCHCNKLQLPIWKVNIEWAEFSRQICQRMKWNYSEKLSKFDDNKWNRLQNGEQSECDSISEWVCFSISCELQWTLAYDSIKVIRYGSMGGNQLKGHVTFFMLSRSIRCDDGKKTHIKRLWVICRACQLNWLVSRVHNATIRRGQLK